MKYESENWSSQIEAYRKGSLSVDERYKLEKAALDDAFLFDALEGHSLYNVATPHSDTESKPRAKTATKVFSIRNMAAAASLILLVGAIGYMTSLPKSDDRLARANDHTIEQAPQTSIAMNSAPESVESVIKGRDNSSTNQQKEGPQEQSAVPAKKESNIHKAKEQVKKPAIDGVAIKETEPVTNSFSEIEEEVVLETKEATDLASTQNPLSEKSNSTLQSRRPNLLTNEDLASRQSNQTLAIQKQEEQNTSTAEVAAPAGGWDAFRSYVDTNKKKISVLKPATIILKFTVGTDGNLSNIRALPSTCSACATEAKRLLSKSGKWISKTGKAQEMQYAIKF